MTTAMTGASTPLPPRYHKLTVLEAWVHDLHFENRVLRAYLREIEAAVVGGADKTAVQAIRAATQRARKTIAMIDGERVA
jgi:hypothetical protein